MLIPYNSWKREFMVSKYKSQSSRVWEIPNYYRPRPTALTTEDHIVLHIRANTVNMSICIWGMLQCIISYLKTIKKRFFKNVCFCVGNGSGADPGDDHRGSDSRQWRLLSHISGCHSGCHWTGSLVCSSSFVKMYLSLQKNVQEIFPLSK